MHTKPLRLDHNNLERSGTVVLCSHHSSFLYNLVYTSSISLSFPFHSKVIFNLLGAYITFLLSVHVFIRHYIFSLAHAISFIHVAMILYIPSYMTIRHTVPSNVYGANVMQVLYYA